MSRISVIALTLTISPFASADLAEDIDALVQEQYENGAIHGSVLVAKNGEVVYKGAVGMANYEWDIPNAPDTKFRLGSITKQFTATLILQLQEQGKLQVEDTISDHLDYYRDDLGKKITIHHLLTHTSGLPNYTAFQKFFSDVSRDYIEVKTFVTDFCSHDLEFEPGEKWRYSNSGYFVLGAIIEAASGMTYEEALKKMTFDPAGMSDSGYDRHAPIMKRRATGYDRKDDAFENSKYLDMQLPFAAGALYSTVEDLYLWDRALYGTKLLSDESKEAMYTVHNRTYGYGWNIRKLKSEGIIGVVDSVEISHGGGINGFQTSISRHVLGGHLVVVLNNAVPSRSSKLTLEIFALLYR